MNGLNGQKAAACGTIAKRIHAQAGQSGSEEFNRSWPALARENGTPPARRPIVGSAEHVLKDTVLKQKDGEEEHPQMGRRPSEGFASVQGLIHQ